MASSNKRFLGKYDSKKGDWLKLAKQIVVVIILAIIVLFTVVGTSRVDGHSMDPTLDNSQIVAYLRVGNNYDYGDIVAIKMPNGSRYVKRIVGKPGDSIDIIDGYVYRNGEQLDEPYVMSEGRTAPEGDKIEYPYTVEKGTYFVLGDNREESVDSRTFGQIIKKNIKGKLLFNN